jgi:hypothetical protein
MYVLERSHDNRYFTPGGISLWRLDQSLLRSIRVAILVKDAWITDHVGKRIWLLKGYSIYTETGQRAESAPPSSPPLGAFDKDHFQTEQSDLFSPRIPRIWPKQLYEPSCSIYGWIGRWRVNVYQQHVQHSP